MGVLSEFFIAAAPEVQDAREQLSEAGPHPQFNTWPMKGLTNVEVCSLEGILTDVSIEDCLDRMGTPVLDFGKNGPWVYRVPDRLIEQLNEVEPNELVEAAAKWAETDELKGWRRSDVKAVIEGLQDLAASALANSKQVFLWISL